MHFQLLVKTPSSCFPFCFSYRHTINHCLHHQRFPYTTSNNAFYSLRVDLYSLLLGQRVVFFAPSTRCCTEGYRVKSMLWLPSAWFPCRAAMAAEAVSSAGHQNQAIKQLPSKVCRGQAWLPGSIGATFMYSALHAFPNLEPGILCSKLPHSLQFVGQHNGLEACVILCHGVIYFKAFAVGLKLKFVWLQTLE